MRPAADPYAPAAPSPREREAAGHPTEQPRGAVDPDSSLPYLPAREPPDPTAGFSFHPAANRSSWRRASHTWESPGGGDGGGGSGGGGGGRTVDRNDPATQQHYAQYPAYFDAVDRPRSAWNSPIGGGGGGGGGGDYPEGRRYRDDFRGGERGQEQRGVVEWHLPHGERVGEPFRERGDLPPTPHAFDRRHQPVERPLAGGGGGGREVRHDEGRGGGVLVGAPPPPGPAPRDDRERQQLSARAAAGGADNPYDRSVGRLGWPGDQMDPQLRGRHGPGPAPSRQDWEEPRRGMPLEQPREAAGGGGAGVARRGGGGGGFPFQWESERGQAFNPSAQEPWRRGGENSRVALPPSSSSAFEACPGRSSSRQGAGEEAGRSPPAPGPGGGGGGHAQSDEQGPEEMDQERDTRHRGGREQTGEGGEPAPTRAPVSGDHPAA